MRLLLTAICLAAVTASAPAWAQQAAATPEASDERCLLAMIALSNSTNQAAARAGQTGVIFYAGRLRGRNPAFDFARLKSMAATMNAQSAEADLKDRCGPTLQTSLQQLQSALAPPASATAPAAKPAAPASPAAKPSASPPPKR